MIESRSMFKEDENRNHDGSITTGVRRVRTEPSLKVTNSSATRSSKEGLLIPSIRSSKEAMDGGVQLNSPTCSPAESPEIPKIRISSPPSSDGGEGGGFEEDGQAESPEIPKIQICVEEDGKAESPEIPKIQIC